MSLPASLPSLQFSRRSALSSPTRISADDAAAATVFSVEPKDWPDACLGLARPDEVCAQVITPGYEIILVDRGNTTYVYRASKAGNVRLEEALLEF